MSEPSSKPSLQEIQNMLMRMALHLDVGIEYLPEHQKAGAIEAVEKARAMAEALMGVESVQRTHPEPIVVGLKGFTPPEAR